MPFLRQHLELIIWPLALLALYLMPLEEQHFSLCIPTALGFNWCPGCGLGHSIHYALHGEWRQSWQEHYLGIFALLIILYRTFSLLKNYYHRNQSVL